MNKRHQPSKAFFRRLKANSEKKPVLAVKPATWIKKFRESDAWLWAEVIAFVAVIATVWQIWVDLQDRQTQRITQAWQLVTYSAPGNSGKGPALEYLNSQGVSLTGIDLSAEENKSRVFLQGINLSGADLQDANLSGADLAYADLSEAYLGVANLTGAILQEANLSGVSFFGADLSGAYLVKADLSGTHFGVANLSEARLDETNLSGADLVASDLSEADLQGANLSGAILADDELSDPRNLSQDQLDSACGDEKTRLPDGFTIEACPTDWGNEP